MFLRKLCYTVNMLKRCLKIFILAAMLCLGMALTSFAAGKEKTVPFPFALELDLEECDRLCYAGHPGNTVQYRDGLAATPDSEFRILNVVEVNRHVLPCIVIPYAGKMCVQLSVGMSFEISL